MKCVEDWMEADFDYEKNRNVRNVQLYLNYNNGIKRNGG